MSDTTSASLPTDAGSPTVSAPTHVSDAVWTVESQSKMAPQTVESLTEELAAPLMSEAKDNADANAAADAIDPPEAPKAEAKADEPAKADEKPPAGKKDRIARLQAEVHQLTRTKYETRAEIDAAAAELAKVKAQLASAQGKPVVPAQVPQDTPAPVAPDDLSALGEKPTWAAYEAQGKSWDEFNDARESWFEAKAELRVTRQIEARAQAAQEQVRTEAARNAKVAEESRFHTQMSELEAADPTFQTRAQELLTQFPYDPSMPDFRMDVVLKHEAGPQVLKHWVDHPEELRSLTDLNDRLTHAMMHAVRSSSDPVPLLSYLATHPQETDEISRLPRERALIALGKISAHVEADAAPPVKPAPGGTAPPVSRAAAPIRPVGGTRTTGDAADIYDLPIEDFLKERNRREVAARRRP